MSDAGGLGEANSWDKTGPTIFLPWIRPMNPGGLDWGNNCLVDAEKEGTLRTLIYDVSGIEKATLHYYMVGGHPQEMELKNLGAYPCNTGAAETSTLFEAIFPAQSGNIRYFIEATDKCGNVSRSPMGRIFVR
jgi:hypothetical protein